MAAALPTFAPQPTLKVAKKISDLTAYQEYGGSISKRATIKLVEDSVMQHLKSLLPTTIKDDLKMNIIFGAEGEYDPINLGFVICDAELAQLYRTALLSSGYSPRSMENNLILMLEGHSDISNYLVYLVGVNQEFLRKAGSQFISARNGLGRVIEGILPWVNILLDPALQQPLEGTPHKIVNMTIDSMPKPYVVNPVLAAHPIHSPGAVHAVRDQAAPGKTESEMLFMMNVARRALTGAGPGAGHTVGAGAGATVPQHENTERKRDADHSEILNQALKDLLPALNRVVQIAEAHKPSDASAQQQTVDLAKALLAALTADNRVKPASP